MFHNALDWVFPLPADHPAFRDLLGVRLWVCYNNLVVLVKIVLVNDLAEQGDRDGITIPG